MTVPLLDIVNLAAGEGQVISTYRGIRLCLIAAATATISYSKVDSPKATAHDTPTTLTTTDVEGISVDVAWPYYYVSVATAGARVALI